MQRPPSDGPNFKHWALFVDDEENPMILHIQGSAGSWRYERRNHHDPRTSNRFYQMIKVGTICKSQIQELVASAVTLEIKQRSNWNCQNWILDLIADIDGTLINISDSAWDSLCQKMDGYT